LESCRDSSVKNQPFFMVNINLSCRDSSIFNVVFLLCSYLFPPLFIYMFWQGRGLNNLCKHFFHGHLKFQWQARGSQFWAFEKASPPWRICFACAIARKTDTGLSLHRSSQRREKVGLYVRVTWLLTCNFFLPLCALFLTKWPFLFATCWKYGT
jgi:hypothetical protein